MEQLDKSLTQYYQVKKELLAVTQRLESCDNEEKDMYQDIALCYSKHLREMNKILKKKYNLDVCSY